MDKLYSFSCIRKHCRGGQFRLESWRTGDACRQARCNRQRDPQGGTLGTGQQPTQYSLHSPHWPPPPMWRIETCGENDSEVAEEDTEEPQSGGPEAGTRRRARTGAMGCNEKKGASSEAFQQEGLGASGGRWTSDDPFRVRCRTRG